MRPALRYISCKEQGSGREAVCATFRGLDERQEAAIPAGAIVSVVDMRRCGAKRAKRERAAGDADKQRFDREFADESRHQAVGLDLAAHRGSWAARMRSL